MATVIRLLTGVIFTAMAVTLLSFDLPTAWIKAGSHPDSYHMGIDEGAGQGGKDVKTIQSTANTIEGFGTLMQISLPEDYPGKRVRMIGWMKTKEVSWWAGFWFRVDEEGSDEPLSFDNMKDGKKDRSIKGTTDWVKYEIVLDVPLNASKLAYGAILAGTGQIWFDDISFEVVDTNIPTTGAD